VVLNHHRVVPEVMNMCFFGGGEKTGEQSVPATWCDSTRP
jgi:hypothetical protein